MQIKNKTLSIHKNIASVVLIIYLMVIQIYLACLPNDLFNNMLLSFFDNDSPFYAFFSERTVSVFINLILFGSCYVVIYAISNQIYKKIWRCKNKDCYLAGRWYHIHTKEDDKTYIRCGVVDIKQNYYDLDIEGCNFALLNVDTSNPNDWKIVSDNNSNVSYWGYDIANLSERGGITATYTSNKVSGSTRTYKGLHKLNVVDHDERGYPSILGGYFSDVAPSTSVGHLRLYRATPVSNSIIRALTRNKLLFNSLKRECSKLKGKNICEIESYNCSYDNLLSQGPIDWKKSLKILLDKKNAINKKSQQESSSMNIKEKKPLLLIIEEKIIQTVKKAGELMLSAEDAKINSFEKTSNRDIYTTYDIAVQKLLIKELGGMIKCSSFIAEEGEWDKRDSLPPGYCFIIDPIDGTSNFSRNYKHSCISVGLAINGEIQIGVVYDPYLNETFHSVKSFGSYLNNKKITCSNAILKNSIVGFGTAPYNPELFHETFSFTEKLFKHCNDLRRSGSSALDICYVASSRLDFFYELSLYPWDYGAASLIASEAGASITDLNEQPLIFTRKCSVACGGPLAFEEFMQIRKEYLKEFHSKD